MRWIKQFEENIQSLPNSIENFPIMVRKNCLCGYWIDRARQEMIFDNLWLNKLDLKHESMHVIAENLISKYQEDGIDDAGKGFHTLRLASTEILSILGEAK